MTGVQTCALPISPRNHGELLKLGFDLSERSVSRWIRRATRNPDPVKRWVTFLRNHRLCDPKPKSLRQAGKNPLNVGHNDLENDMVTIGFLSVGIAFLLCSLPMLWGLRGKVPLS